MAKKTFSQYIDEEVISEFKDYCEKQNLHEPKMLEELIKVFLKRTKNETNKNRS